MKKCYLCDSQEAGLVVSCQPPFFRCKECGVVYSCPQPTDEELKGFYSQSYYHSLHRKEDVINFKYKENLRLIDKYFSQKGRLLDVGCAVGFFMELAQKTSNWEVYGLDLSKWAVNYARKEIGLNNVEVGTIEEGKFAANSFEVVVMCELIEHAKNPLLVLKEAFRVLKNGGMLLITTPNTGGIQAKLWGKRWWQLAREHMFLFDNAVLTQLLERVGFEVVEVLTRPYLRRYFDYAVSRNPFLRMRAYCRKTGFWLIDRLKAGELLVICGRKI